MLAVTMTSTNQQSWPWVRTSSRWGWKTMWPLVANCDFLFVPMPAELDLKTPEFSCPLRFESESFPHQLLPMFRRPENVEAAISLILTTSGRTKHRQICHSLLVYHWYPYYEIHNNKAPFNKHQQTIYRKIREMVCHHGSPTVDSASTNGYISHAKQWFTIVNSGLKNTWEVPRSSSTNCSSSKLLELHPIICQNRWGY